MNQIHSVWLFPLGVLFVSISVSHRAENTGTHARTMERSDVRAILPHLLNAPETSAQ